MANGGEAGPPENNGDSFESATFNVTHYVNSRFPNEESLAGLEPAIRALKTKIQRVDAEILGAVQQQSSSGSRAREDLTTAKSSIAQLLAQLSDIRRKAAASEVMVQEICRDIKKLDTAKTNLTTTITGLRRVAMLVAAVDQLQLAVERHEYAEAAHLLGAVQQLSAHFRSHRHLPRVAEMRTRLTTLEQSLRVSTLREFELLGEEQPSPALLDRLRACCAVAAALGPAARDELVDAVCRREMGVYTSIFGTVGDTARLDRTVNRYKWLLRRLEARRDVWAIFPPDWRLQQLLCVTFCSITKSALAEILDVRAAELPHQVEALLRAVEATHIFEAEMARRFGERQPNSLEERRRRGDGSDDELLGDGECLGIGDGDGSDAAGGGAEEVRRRYERQLAERDGSPGRAERQQHAAAEAVARASFLGSISPAFHPYLKLYVDQVERELLWSVEQMVKAETWRPLSPDQPILKSSNELTDAIGAEVRECCARVSRGATLLDLAAVFQRVYRAYAARLVGSLPKTAAGGTAGVAVLGTSDWQVRLGDGDFEVICLIITTAEHCQEMVRQLARALAQRLGPPLSAQVDFCGEEDEFQAVVAHCLSVLLLGVETKIEGGLAAMAKHNWAAVQSAGDQSEYAGVIRAALAEAGLSLGPALPPNHFRFLCDRLLRSLAPRLAESVLRCRRVSDAGCQQLRLDLEAIKGGLVGLARAGPADNDPGWVHGFAGDVNAQLGRAEAVLKVVASPAGAMVETFLELLPHSSPADFQRIAELKVLKRLELAAVLEEYVRRVGRPMPAAATKTAASAAAVAGPAAGTGAPPALPTAPWSAAAAAQVAGAGQGRAGQDMASMFKPNMQAARASAAAAGDSMRETMGRTFGKMKSLRFGKQQDGG